MLRLIKSDRVDLTSEMIPADGDPATGVTLGALLGGSFLIGLLVGWFIKGIWFFLRAAISSG